MATKSSSSAGRLITAVVGYVKLKYITLTQAVAVVIAATQALGISHLDRTQITAVMAVPPVIWVLLGASTVTSNLRLTGKMWGGPDGVTASDVAANVANNVVELSGPAAAPDPVQAAGGPASRGA